MYSPFRNRISVSLFVVVVVLSSLFVAAAVSANHDTSHVAPISYHEARLLMGEYDQVSTVALPISYHQARLLMGEYDQAFTVYPSIYYRDAHPVLEETQQTPRGYPSIYYRDAHPVIGE